MQRQATRPVPRWQRGKQKPQASMPVTLRGRHAKALTRELIRAGQQHGKAAREGTATANGMLAGSGAWRFRRHLAPFGLLTCLSAAGLILPRTAHPFLYGNLASLAAPVLIVLSTRHLSRYARNTADVWAAFTALWLPAFGLCGFGRPIPALLALTWAPLAALWVRQYRWRPSPKEKTETAAADIVTWDRLTARRKWAGQLTAPEDIPGGRKWQIELDGIETHIGQVMSEPRAIAAAWGKAQTEAYVEPHPTGIESKGTLTILKAGTIQEVHEWDGSGFGEDGIARIGRFADGQPARIRCWVPRDGTRHGLIAGCMGSGKSALLDLLVWLALTSPVPVVPVILDPQNGQSLPQWQDKVLYAAGVEECVRMVRGLNAGMMDRSRRLASMTWEDDGHKVKGMEFFDARLTGLPVVMAITDEAPLLLSGGGNAKLSAEMIRLEGEGGKLGRKTGMSKWLVAQVPSLSELGDQALRSMLVGGNVVCLRTGDRVSAGMLGLETDPSVLPKYFQDGEPTAGLGYAVSLDNRQAPFRTDMVPRRMRHEAAEVAVLDDGFLEAMDRAMGIQGVLLPQIPSPAPAEDAPEGRRCIDAVWQVLTDSGKPMERGDVIYWVNELATTGWGRDRPFSIRAIGDACAKLAEGKEPGRTVTKPRDGVYQASLRDHTSPELPGTTTAEGQHDGDGQAFKTDARPAHARCVHRDPGRRTHPRVLRGHVRGRDPPARGNVRQLVVDRSRRH